MQICSTKRKCSRPLGGANQRMQIYVKHARDGNLVTKLTDRQTKRILCLLCVVSLLHHRPHSYVRVVNIVHSCPDIRSFNDERSKEL